MHPFTTHDGLRAVPLAHVSLPDVIVRDVGLRSRDGLNAYEVGRIVHDTFMPREL